MAKPRTCGTCDVCCTTPFIREFDKPAHEPCANLFRIRKKNSVGAPATNVPSKGCAIYADRPPVCRVFKCAWITGGLPSEFRPDRSGLLIYGAPKELDPERELAIVLEVSRGALDVPSNLALVKRLIAEKPTAVTRRDGDRVMLGPQSKVQRLQAWLEEEAAKEAAADLTPAAT